MEVENVGQQLLPLEEEGEQLQAVQIPQQLEIKDKIIGNFYERISRAGGINQYVLGIRQLVPGDTMNQPLSRYAYYIYQDGLQENGIYEPKPVFDMLDDTLPRAMSYDLVNLIPNYGFITQYLENISRAFFSIQRTSRNHFLPQRHYIAVFEGIVRIGSQIANVIYTNKRDYRILDPLDRGVLELYLGQFKGEIEEVFPDRPEIEDYQQYQLRLFNRMQLFPFRSRCKGLINDSDWYPGYQCFAQQLGFQAANINNMRNDDHNIDVGRYPNSLMGSATYIQSLGLHPNIIQTVMIWIIIILSSAATRTYRRFLQMFLFPLPHDSRMQQIENYDADIFSNPINFFPPYGIHMLFSLAVRSVMLAGLNSITMDQQLEVPLSEHVWGMQSMSAPHAIIKQFAMNFGSMFTIQIANLPFTEMFETFARFRHHKSRQGEGVFITAHALLFLQIEGDPTHYTWTQHIFAVFDVPWKTEAHRLLQTLDYFTTERYNEPIAQIQRVAGGWNSSNPMDAYNKKAEQMRQLARGMERMRWLLDNGVIPNIPDPLRLTVVDKHYRSWSMSLARKTYYKYAYFYDHVLPIELPTLSIVDFYQDQQRNIIRELWSRTKNVYRNEATNIVPKTWIPQARHTRSIFERSVLENNFIQIQDLFPVLTCLQHVMMFLVCAVETKFDENVNLLEIAERLKSPHIHNDPLKIIKEPKDGQYELTLRVIHMESRRVIRLHYKSNNAEFHYRLITVVVRHMDAFVVSEHDGDDITYELDKQRRQEKVEYAKLLQDHSILIFYDCETTCGIGETCIPYLIAYSIYEWVQGMYQNVHLQQTDYACNLIEGEDCFDQFIKFLEEFAIQNKKKKIKVIAYNGARFDNLFLLKAMFNNNLTTDLFLGGTVTNLKYIKTGNLIIQDMLMMVGGGSLNNACKVLIGPEYQKHDCPEILEINSIAAWESMDWPIQEKIKHYCCQDVLLLFSLYQRLATNLSSLASQLHNKKINIMPEHSIAASAYKIIMSFINQPKPIDSQTIYEAVKQSYFGGHTEIYNLNKSDVWKYDWNSAYPFVMANSTFPTSMNKIVHLPAETTCESVSDCVRLKISQCRLYRLKSFRFLHGWPMIHIRYKESIVLPLQYDGTIWVWGDTLLWSMAITKMSFTYDAVIYSTDPRERSFQFLEDIYQKRVDARAAGNEGLAQVYKMFMNSAYGKMGTKNYPEKIYFTKPQLEETEGQHDGWFYDKCNNRNGPPLQVKSINHVEELNAIEVVFVESEMPEKVKCRQIYIASLITARCRSLLLALAHSIRNTLVYCDTDSLMTSSPLLPFVPKLVDIYEHLEEDPYNCYEFSIGNNLGQWKYEDCTNRQPVKGFQAFAKKVYSMDKIVKIKGLHGQNQQEATKKLQEIQNGAKIIWEQTQWTRRPGEVRQIRVQKELQFKYNRIVRQDGTTSPLPTIFDLNSNSVYRDCAGVFLYKHD